MTEEGSEDGKTGKEFMFVDTSDGSTDGSTDTDPEDTQLPLEESESGLSPEGDDGSDRAVDDHDDLLPVTITDSHEETDDEPDTPGTDPEVASSETDLDLPSSETDLESASSETALEWEPEDGDGDERTGTDGPLGDLADRIRDREGDGDEEFDDLFDREDVGGIDREKLWEQVRGEDDPLEDIDVEREIREIPKSTYCHQCEHFSSPPEVACNNGETDILELVDLETFRVADCPIVLKNERLEGN